MTELSTLALKGPEWIGEARRGAVGLAQTLGFTKAKLAGIELVATEMATNLISHRAASPIFRFGVTRIVGARGNGETPDEGSGLLLISEDRGPGISDPERAMQDRYSTAGTMGGGLGAIRRHSDEFCLSSEVSRPGRPHPGTLVISRHWPGPSPQGSFDCEVLTRMKPGETENGDGIYFFQTGERYQMAVIDGLGHGMFAHKAAGEVEHSFRSNRPFGIEGMLKGAHGAMHNGRGAVVGILELDRKAQTAVYAGVGNIDCRIYGKNPARPISMNGSLGVALPHYREESFTFGPDDFFIMASDGLSGRWEPENYSHFLRFPFVVRAALLFRDQSRPNDDATVAVGGFRM